MSSKIIEVTINENQTIEKYKNNVNLGKIIKFDYKHLVDDKSFDEVSYFRN